MTSRPKRPISWVDSFRSILTMEESRGFDNKAVMGGLDRFIQTVKDIKIHLQTYAYSGN